MKFELTSDGKITGKVWYNDVNVGPDLDLAFDALYKGINPEIFGKHPDLTLYGKRIAMALTKGLD